MENRLDKMFSLADQYNDSAERIAKENWDKKIWLKWYHKHKADRNTSAVRALRIAVQESTIAACENGFYKLSDGSYVNIGSSEEIQKSIEQNELVQKISNHFPKKFNDTSIEVCDRDCLECAIDLKDKYGLNPAVLNMASMKRPGGGYRNGAGAQEENLFRRSNYYQHLEHYDQAKCYPLPEFGGIYSPNVKVFRSSESTGYDFLPVPHEISFIAVAAYARPSTVSTGTKNNLKLRLTDKLADKTKDKIRTILNMGLKFGHDSLVLSAFGCGAFGNPPEHMAKLFHEVIYKEYQGKFKHIAFAIIDDDNARKAHNPQGNVVPFQEIFHDAKSMLSTSVTTTSSSDNNNNNNNNDNKAEPDKATPEDENYAALMSEDLKKLSEISEIKFYRPRESFGYFSNFSAHSILLDGKKWPTVEHYVQAKQFVGTKIEEEIRSSKSPNDACRIARENKGKVRNDWKAVQDSIVKTALKAKLEQHHRLAEQLKATSPLPILFTSTEAHFGVGPNEKGKNLLGNFLMELRSELIEGVSTSGKEETQ